MSEPGELRVSDEQRDRAAAEIRDHFAAGRLTDDELSDRLSAIYRARTESELHAARSDLPVLPATQRMELARRRGELQRRLLQQTGGALAPFVICTVIWASSGAGFFWPIWVLLFTLIPLVRNGWRLYGPAPELDRVEEELEQRSRRDRRDQSRRDRDRDRHRRRD